MYDTWNGGNMDEGWTRWVLEQYGFRSTRLHNADVRAGGLSDKYDAIILPDQSLNSILEGNTASTTRPEYRGGIGDEGVAALKSFVNAGGTLITLGAACDLAIAKFPVPVRNLKSDLTRDQHFAPGSILRVDVDTRHPIGYGMAATSHGFYVNSPFFSVVEGFASQRATVVARYPNTDVLASGWLRGEKPDGRPRRGRLHRHESRPHRPVRPAPAAPRADPRDVPDAVQRAVSGRRRPADFIACAPTSRLDVAMALRAASSLGACGALLLPLDERQ